MGGFSPLDEKGTSFNYHPIMMVASFCLMTVAFLAFRLPWLSGQSRNLIKAVHGLSWLGAITTSSIGLWAVFKAHNDNMYANLYSLHSWFGICVFALFLFNWVCGFFLFGMKVGPDSLRSTFMPLHKYLGTVVYVGYAAAILLGLLENDTFYDYCGYAITTPDTNPAENYDKISHVCRLAHAVGFQVFAMTLTAGFVIVEL